MNMNTVSETLLPSLFYSCILWVPTADLLREESAKKLAVAKRTNNAPDYCVAVVR